MAPWKKLIRVILLLLLLPWAAVVWELASIPNGIRSSHPYYEWAVFDRDTTMLFRGVDENALFTKRRMSDMPTTRWTRIGLVSGKTTVAPSGFSPLHQDVNGDFINWFQITDGNAELRKWKVLCFERTTLRKLADFTVELSGQPHKLVGGRYLLCEKNGEWTACDLFGEVHTGLDRNEVKAASNFVIDSSTSMQLATIRGGKIEVLHSWQSGFLNATGSSWDNETVVSLSIDSKAFEIRSMVDGTLLHVIPMPLGYRIDMGPKNLGSNWFSLHEPNGVFKGNVAIPPKSWHFDRHSGEEIDLPQQAPGNTDIFDRHSESGRILMRDDVNSPSKIVNDLSGEMIGEIPYATSGSRFSADGSKLFVPSQHGGIAGWVRFLRVFDASTGKLLSELYESPIHKRAQDLWWPSSAVFIILWFGIWFRTSSASTTSAWSDAALFCGLTGVVLATRLLRSAFPQNDERMVYVVIAAFMLTLIASSLIIATRNEWGLIRLLTLMLSLTVWMPIVAMFNSRIGPGLWRIYIETMIGGFLVVFAVWITHRIGLVFSGADQHRNSDSIEPKKVPVTLSNLLVIMLLSAIHFRGIDSMDLPPSWQNEWRFFMILIASSVIYTLLVLAFYRLAWWKRYAFLIAVASACLYAGIAIFALVEGLRFQTALTQILSENVTPVAILGKRQLVMWAWCTVFLGCWIAVLSRINKDSRAVNRD